MHQPWTSVLVLWSIGLLVAACAAPVPVKVAETPAPAPEKAAPALKPGDIVDTRTGKAVSFEDLMEDLSHVQVVYAGETHTSSDDHRVQLEILEAMHARGPSVALAMEMFPRESQPVLDQYVGGKISEDVFLKKSRWKRVWGYPYPLYQGLLTFARENRLKLIGLNAPREVVARIARAGLASLKPGERKRVARSFHLDDARHREYVREEYEQHARGDIKDFETFFEAQLAWEETMAETLVQALGSLPKDGRILVLVGKGHIIHGVGLPQLALERRAYTFRTVAPIPVDGADEAIASKIADYVWVTEKSASPHRGRLGVMIRPAASGKGLEIVGVSPDSPAAAAGVEKGDVLYAVDGVAVKNIDGLHRAIAGETKIHELKVRRGGREISITVTLSP